jgi:hypothetical protein
MGRGDPPPRLPVGDAVAHGEPVGHVVRAVVAPDLAEIRVGDQTQQLSLFPTDARVGCVETLQQ